MPLSCKTNILKNHEVQQVISLMNEQNKYIKAYYTSGPKRRVPSSGPMAIVGCRCRLSLCCGVVIDRGSRCKYIYIFPFIYSIFEETTAPPLHMAATATTMTTTIPAIAYNRHNHRTHTSKYRKNDNGTFFYLFLIYFLLTDMYFFSFIPHNLRHVSLEERHRKEGRGLTVCFFIIFLYTFY